MVPCVCPATYQEAEHIPIYKGSSLTVVFFIKRTKAPPQTHSFILTDNDIWRKSPCKIAECKQKVKKATKQKNQPLRNVSFKFITMPFPASQVQLSTLFPGIWAQTQRLLWISICLHAKLSTETNCTYSIFLMQSNLLGNCVSFNYVW